MRGNLKQGWMAKERCRAVGSMLGIFWICMFTPAWADGQKIVSAIDEKSLEYNAVSQEIWGWKEPGQQEYKSSALLKEELRKLGFRVSGDLSVPPDLVKGGVAKTAFKAEMAGKGPG